MKRFALFCMTIAISMASYGQELPYSKYLNFSKSDFKENNFKYHEKANIWSLNKIDGLNTTLNILSIIADAEEDVRPDVNDYSIIVQLGADDAVSYVRVMYYKDETYHKLLAFMIGKGGKYVGNHVVCREGCGIHLSDGLYEPLFAVTQGGATECLQSGANFAHLSASFICICP